MGQDSLGYQNSQEYLLTLRDKGGSSISRIDGTGVCPYDSLSSFLRNWTNIRAAGSMEDKQGMFLEEADKNKANFDLHRRLIKENLMGGEDKRYQDDLKDFLNGGKVSGVLLLRLINYAEEYAREVNLKQ